VLIGNKSCRVTNVHYDSPKRPQRSSLLLRNPKEKDGRNIAFLLCLA